MKKALKSVPEDAQQLMKWKLPTLARVVNGWSMNTDTMGVYGNYYLKRAIVAYFGLGANLPEDAIYPLNLADETGQPLDGVNKYTLHFAKGATSLRLFTTLATLGTPQDVTAQEIRIECFFPADRASADIFREWATRDGQ